jgi:hypothetical protein
LVNGGVEEASPMMRGPKELARRQRRHDDELVEEVSPMVRGPKVVHVAVQGDDRLG